MDILNQDGLTEQTARSSLPSRLCGRQVKADLEFENNQEMLYLRVPTLNFSLISVC